MFGVESDRIFSNPPISVRGDHKAVCPAASRWPGRWGSARMKASFFSVSLALVTLALAVTASDSAESTSTLAVSVGDGQTTLADYSYCETFHYCLPFIQWKMDDRHAFLLLRDGVF